MRGTVIVVRRRDRSIGVGPGMLSGPLVKSVLMVLGFEGRPAALEAPWCGPKTPGEPQVTNLLKNVAAPQRHTTYELSFLKVGGPSGS